MTPSAYRGKMCIRDRIESYLEEGCQPIEGERAYGKSITDPCLGWEDTERLLLDMAERV